MDMVPTMLGAVARSTSPDVEVLTGSLPGGQACDMCADYVKGIDISDEPIPGSDEDLNSEP